MVKIAVIGTGLIGTSLGLALRQSPLQELQVVGTDASSEARAGANKRGAFHKVEGRLMSAIDGADIVVLATPIMAMQEVMEIIGPELPDECVVTDVGSSKGVVMEWANQHLPKNVDYVGGHPMAGKETAGPAAGDGDLFRGKTYCVVPSPTARQRAVAEVTTLVETIGAKPFFIGVDEHDSFVAAASHLPFLMSAALVGCTSKSPNWDDIAHMASSGYRDMSRLASGDTVMHRDICVSNSQPILAWIDSFIRELYEFRKLLAVEDQVDPEAIKAYLDQVAEARDKWQAGEVNAAAREGNPHAEIPSFTESMGEMFAGRRAVEAQKKVMGGFLNRGRKNK